MKTLKQFIIEDMASFSGFVIPRSQMPQINNLDHYINYIDQLKIPYTKSNGSVDSFRPTQHEYDQDKVGRIISDWVTSNNNTDSKSIVVSNDGFVVDGHHRYFASQQSGMSINYIEIDLPLNKLLKLTMDYVDSYG